MCSFIKKIRFNNNKKKIGFVFLCNNYVHIVNIFEFTCTAPVMPSHARETNNRISPSPIPEPASAAALPA